MSSSNYRLRSVLEVRIRAREEATHHLAFCRQNLTENEDQLKKISESLKVCETQILNFSKTMNEEIGSGIRAGQILTYKNHLEELKRNLKRLESLYTQQKEKVKKAESLVLKATKNLNSASKEVKIVEKHKEKWVSKEKFARKKASEKANDELVTNLHHKTERL